KPCSFFMTETDGIMIACPIHVHSKRGYDTRAMKTLILIALFTQNPLDLAKKAATGAASGEAEKRVNAKLMEEGRKNQCSFKTDSDELMAGCDAKIKKLANALSDAKKQLDTAVLNKFNT